MSFKDLWPDSSDEESDEPYHAKSKVVYVPVKKTSQAVNHEEKKNITTNTKKQEIKEPSSIDSKPKYRREGKAYKKTGHKDDKRHDKKPIHNAKTHKTRKFEEEQPIVEEPAHDFTVVLVDPEYTSLQYEIGFKMSYSVPKIKEMVEDMKTRYKLDDEKSERIKEAVIQNLMKSKPELSLKF